MGRTSLLSTTIQQDTPMAKKSKTTVERYLTHVELGPARKNILGRFRAKKQLNNTPVTSDEKAILQLLDTHPDLKKV